MSQFYLTPPGGAPAIPTAFVTDSGTATPAANTLNIVTGLPLATSTVNGIQTSASGSTVTIQLTNALYGSATLTGVGPTTLVTLPLNAGSVYRIYFQVTGRDTTSGDGVGYDVWGSIKRVGSGAAVIIQSPFIDTDEDVTLNTGSINLIASGNNAVLQVTGVVGRTIAYNATGYYTVV